MITITDEITEDNYHILFSCADAQRTSVDEVIFVDVNLVDLADCSSLVSLPDNLTVNGFLILDDCLSLVSLPDNLIVNGDLYLNDCTSLTTLPNNLTVDGNIYVDSDKVAEFKKMNKKFAHKIF
jgi:hypothetical protein